MRLNICIRRESPVPLPRLSEPGLGLEIQDFISPVVLDAPAELLSSYRKLLGRLPIPLAFHGPMLDLRPASPDPKIVEVTRTRYLQALECVVSLKGEFLILHSQLIPYLSPAKSDRMIEQQIPFWRDFLAGAAKKNVTVLLENVFDPFPGFLRDLIDAVEASNLACCLDVGHVTAYSKTSLEKWVEKLQAHIRYLHVHESCDGIDKHAPPSEIWLKRIFSAITEKGISPVFSLEYACDDFGKEISRVLSVGKRFNLP